VLSRGALVVTHIRTGKGTGSDHRPLVATVAFLP
jgi:endonuclease/exonuclease/phosphatase (EEP) superfamily protein YafD